MHVFRHVVIFMLFVYDAVKLLFTFNCSYVASTSVRWFGGGGAAADSSVYSYGKEV